LENTTGLRGNWFIGVLRKLLWPSLVVLAMFLWATVYPVTKIIAGQLSPISISFFRYAFGALPLLPLFLAALRRLPSRPGRWDWVVQGALGLLGVGCFSALQVYGIWASTASNGAVLANTQPIFVVLLSPLMIDERFSLRSLVGSAIGLIGIVLVVAGGGSWRSLLKGEYLVGNLLLLGASLSLSLYTILLKGYVSRFGGMVPTFISMLSGSVFLFLGVIAAGDMPRWVSIPLSAWLYLLFIGLAGTALAYPVFNLALSRLGAVRSSGYKFLVPVFGLLLSFLMLGERPALFTLAGAGLVVIAVLLIH
jgi:drug/metabolite transporter (DMT)-like permease